MVERVLFASCHGYIDPSNGAAVSSRDLMEVFAARGLDARVLSTGILDYARETPLGPLLEAQGLAFTRAHATLNNPVGSARVVEVYDMTLNGVRVALMPTASSRGAKAISSAEAASFLDLAEQVFDRFRPQVMLTYGGHDVSRELMKRARRRGIRVVFHLRNFEYEKNRLFEDVDGLVVTTEYTGRHYARILGRPCRVIPNPIRSDRLLDGDHQPRYLTFVNPQRAKGVTVFARIAAELERRRPDVPILVVESRGTSAGLAQVPLDLSGLNNLHRMANTPDPRDFYRVSRAVLVPSLWRETFGRVVSEAMSNGIPVLASDRGALPETVGDGGFIFSIPDRYQPDVWDVPTAREVEPWLRVIERLWDDPEWEALQRQRARRSAARWDEGRIARAYGEYFEALVQTPSFDSPDSEEI